MFVWKLVINSRVPILSVCWAILLLGWIAAKISVLRKTRIVKGRSLILLLDDCTTELLVISPLLRGPLNQPAYECHLFVFRMLVYRHNRNFQLKIDNHVLALAVALTWWNSNALLWLKLSLSRFCLLVRTGLSMVSKAVDLILRNQLVLDALLGKELAR